MVNVLLTIHVLVALAMAGVILVQRSEGGGLGIGSSQGMGTFMTGRGTANLLTRATSILGALFLGLSLTLALMNRGTTIASRSILDNPPAPAAKSAPHPAPIAKPATPVPVPAVPTN